MILGKYSIAIKYIRIFVQKKLQLKINNINGLIVLNCMQNVHEGHTVKSCFHFFYSIRITWNKCSVSTLCFMLISISDYDCLPNTLAQDIYISVRYHTNEWKTIVSIWNPMQEVDVFGRDQFRKNIKQCLFSFIDSFVFFFCRNIWKGRLTFFRSVLWIGSTLILIKTSK